jgi:hypothetical protein
MPKHVNSASRLFAISEKVAASRDDAPMLDMWVKIFGLKGDLASPIEVCRRLVWVSEEVDAMLIQMGATHFSEHLYLKPAQGMRSAASPTAINARAQAIKGSCSEPVRTGLEFCADALPDEEEILDVETIHAMADLIQSLRDLASSSELPTYLVQVIHRHVDLLQNALSALPIKGVKALTEAAMSAYGQIDHMARDIREKPEAGDVGAKKAVLDQLKQTWTSVGKVIDSSDKLRKLMVLGYTGYKALELVFKV